MPEPDPRAILDALHIHDATALAPVAGGWDTALWKVERPGPAALRVFRPEQAETCRREAIALAAARQAGIPVPAVEARGVWADRPALLLSWCRGRTLMAELMARPGSVWALGQAFGRIQARIHAVPAPEGLRRPDRDWIEAAGPDEVELKARLRALRLRDDALLHLDYHPLNVLTDGRRITAVLDWANAAVGDPRADVARTLALLRLAPTPPGTPHALATLLRRLLAAAWRRGYRELAGPQPEMALFYAWAGAEMLRDLTPKLGKPGVWLEPRHFKPIRRWTAMWKLRAKAPPAW